MANLSRLKGIDQKSIDQLEWIGIETVEDLLRMGSNREGRIKLMDATSLSEVQILKLVNVADLFSIRAITGEFAVLLENIGVDSLEDLAFRRPESLQEQLILENWKHNVVPVAPDLKSVTEWVSKATMLVRRIQHRE